MSNETEPPTASDVLAALRELWKKLATVETKVDQLLQSQAKLAFKTGKVAKPNPQQALLVGKMTAAWLKAKGIKYEWHPRDAKGAQSLLKRGMTIDELVARWEWAFKNGCNSVADFDLNFNKWQPSSPSNRPQVSAGDDLYKENK